MGIQTVSQALSNENGGFSPFGFKNRIINGAMVIDQRNAGASITPTDGAFSVDRWKYSLAQASKFTTQQSTTAPTGFSNSILVTSSSAYSLLSTDNFNVIQWIEGYNTADLGWGAVGAQTVTLSFWVRSSLTGTFGGSIVNNNQNYSYPFTYTISNANTFEYKTITIPGPTAGTWSNTTTTRNIGIWFGLGVGSTGSGTAGAWAASGYYSATGATSVVSNNGATFYITGVQFEKGPQATAFDYRDYGRELQMCQRYYEQYSFSNRTSMFGGAQSTNQAEILFRYMVIKRASPTISVNNYLAFRVNDWRGGDQQASGFTVNESDPIQARFQFIKATANLNVGYVIYMNSQNIGTDPTIYINAEL